MVLTIGATYDLGYGIRLNFTNTLITYLPQLYKIQVINKNGLNKEDLSETLISVLTSCVCGSCYPNAHPKLAQILKPQKIWISLMNIYPMNSKFSFQIIL